MRTSRSNLGRTLRVGVEFRGMPGGSSLVALLAVVAATAVAMPGNAASRDTVSSSHPEVQWSGSLDRPAPFGCKSPRGCDKHSFDVVAPRGAWITVTVGGDQNASLRVTTSDGQL